MNEVTENYSKALTLHRRLISDAQIVQNSLYDLCCCMREMHTQKLYKELGYETFEEYTEKEVGIKKRQAYNYIKIAETYGESVQSIAHIGTTKLALLSSLDEEQREEILENTDVESTSVRELKEKIAKLEQENKEVSESAEFYKNYADEIEEKAKAKANEAEKEISILQEQVAELENRPVEVAVQEEDTAKIKQLENDLLGKDTKIQELKDESSLKDSRINALNLQNENLAKNIESIKSEYETKLSSITQTSDTKETFKAYLSNAIDAANRLITFVKANPDELYKDKCVALLTRLFEDIKNV